VLTATTVLNPPQHATVATNSPHPPLTGTVDDSLIVKQLERKHRLESRDPPSTNPPRSPRRPGHVSHKSLSAIPTLSTINIVPFAPSPLGSPTASKTAASSRASSRRPSAASVRSQRSWIGKTPATTTNGTTTMASPHEGASQGQGGPLSGAADLLRQAMMSGSQRYVQTSHVFLIICPVISPCNFTCYTHARNPHALLGVFRPPHRHWHGTAPAKSPPQAHANAAMAIHAPGTALGILQNDRRWQRSVRFAPRARNVGRTPAKHHAVSAFFSRSRSVTPRSDGPLGGQAFWQANLKSPASLSLAVRRIQISAAHHYSARCMCKQSAPSHHQLSSTPLRAVQLVSCRAACITSTASLLPAPWPSLTRILPTAGLPSTTTRSPMTR
jgi:hypothetical protein